MEIQIIAQGKKDRPKLKFIQQPIIDLGENQKMIFCVLEGGMASGEPSVLIVSSDAEGSVVMQTSLDKFLAAGTGMVAMAENQWNWKQPEGHATLLPPDKETRKALLLKIQKELQEWDEAETAADDIMKEE